MNSAGDGGPEQISDMLFAQSQVNADAALAVRRTTTAHVVARIAIPYSAFCVCVCLENHIAPPHLVRV